MAKYVYIVCSGKPSAYVDMDSMRFEMLGADDSPHKEGYEPRNSVREANNLRLNKLLVNPVLDLTILKFDAKPPYLYHGLVQ